MSTNDVNQKGANTGTSLQSQLYRQNDQSSSGSVFPDIESNHREEKIFTIIKLPKSSNGLSHANSGHATPDEDGVKLNPNSLISISKEVLHYIKETKSTRGTDVTNYILQKLNVSQTDLSFKNIQRRVYDAINVMNAIGILHKDKNNLTYKGHGKFKQSFYKSGLRNRNSVLKDKLNYRAGIINTKQHELMSICLKVYSQ
jgi:hypothetical protein